MSPEILKYIQNIFTTPDTLFGTGALGPLEPLLLQFLRTTSEDMTTKNAVVISAWATMLAIANALFVLLILIGTIHTMIAPRTGSLSLPLSQFVPK